MKFHTIELQNRMKGMLLFCHPHELLYHYSKFYNTEGWKRNHTLSAKNRSYRSCGLTGNLGRKKVLEHDDVHEKKSTESCAT